MSRYIVTVEQGRDCKECEAKIPTGALAIKKSRWLHGKQEITYVHYPQCPPKVSKAVG